MGLASRIERMEVKNVNSKNLGGFMGKMLRVNLTEGTIREEVLSKELAENYIGGSGIGAKILFDEVDPGVEALSAENKVIFATGPLTGTRTPCSGRYAVIFKSPLTNAYCDAHSGGHFPAELKFSGFDVIIIEGASKKPVYLWINNGKAELRDADHLWGKNVYETTDQITEELGDEKIKVAAIGRAGEKLVKFACIINDKGRAPGRGGSGAVLGFKKLKAIAVRGSMRPPIADEDAFKAIVSETHAILKEFEGLAGLKEFGTAVFVNALNAFGVLPTKNYQYGVFEEADKISGETLAKTLLTKRTYCYSCPIGCGRWSKVTEGPYAGVDSEGPEYETLAGFGSNCGNSDLASIIKCNDLCSDYGMDTISCSNTIAFALECLEKKIMFIEDADGLQLDWGAHDAIVKLTEKVGERDGLGDILAEGIMKVSGNLGSEAQKIAMHVKGMETAMHEPRGYKGQGLAFATSNRGACHIRPYTGVHEVFGVPYSELDLPAGVDRFSEEGKAQMVKVWQDFTNFINALDICQFVAIFPTLQYSHLVKLFNSATGLSFSVEDAKKAGERIHNLQRIYNVKAGFGRDGLPHRLVSQSMSSGPVKDQVVDIETMLNEYYELRGWDANGVPSKQKLQELDLG